MTAEAPAKPARSRASARKEFIVGGGAVVLFFVVFGLWAAFARLDAAVHGGGFVIVSGHRQAVQHREGGIVSGIYVREGDQVSAGEVLLEISGGEIAAREQALFSQVARLEAARARLLAEGTDDEELAPPAFFATLSGDRAEEAQTILAVQEQELAARRAALESQRDVLHQRENQLSQQIAGYRRQEQAQKQQSALLDQEIAGVRRLNEKGLASTSRLRALERNHAALEGNAGEYRAQSARAAEAMGETRIQRILLDQQNRTQAAEELRQTELRLSELRPQLAAASEQMERLRLRAPAAGSIVNMAVFTVGGVVGPGQTLMEVVPSNRELLVEAHIRPEDADDLAPGQSVQVRILAFQQREMPLLSGVVRRVSADRLVDERSGIPYFRSELAVSEATVRAAEREIGRQLALRPGLPVEIIVPLRKRTALEYFLEPLRGAMWRSFREH
jgi:HlyD family secretion protein